MSDSPFGGSLGARTPSVTPQPGGGFVFHFESRGDHFTPAEIWRMSKQLAEALLATGRPVEELVPSLEEAKRPILARASPRERANADLYVRRLILRFDPRYRRHPGRPPMNAWSMKPRRPPSLAELDSGSASKFSGGAGPPPPSGVLTGSAQPIHQPLPRATVPSTNVRWLEEGREWLREKQARGKWLGRNGYEALRFLGRCGEWIRHTPLKTSESDLWEVARRVGPADRTKGFYLGLLGVFLSWRGNWVVRSSGILREFPRRAVNTPVVPAEDRDRVLSAAQGPERVVIALLSDGRRRVEVVRARVSDFHPERNVYDFRAKGGHGEITHRDQPASSSLLKELAWWLPLREEWSRRAKADTGHLLCRREGARLVGVSYQYVDRLLDSAEDRARTRRWPAHSFRRGAATLARERGADWEDVSGILGDSSPEVTRGYVEPFVRRRRVAAALRLIEPGPPGARP